MQRRIPVTVLSAAACLVVAVGGAPASAGVADFYKGKTVTVIVPSGSGGTFHVYGQLVARHIGKHIPGNPQVIVQNRPGAGGVNASNYMSNAAPKDGSIIAEMNPGAVAIAMMRKVRYDPRKFQWLGAATVRSYTLAVWHTVAADTIEKLKKTEVIMGSSGVGSLNYQLPYFMNYAIGTKFKIIKGYKGGGGINLAMERGEVQGRGNFYSGYTGAKPEWLRDGKVKLFAVMGPIRPEVKNVPLLRDFIKPGVDRAMFNLLEVGPYIGQSFYVSPGVPKVRTVALRTAFENMLKDPAMQAEAKKRRVPLISRDWRYSTKVVNDAYNVPPDVPKKLAGILGFGNKPTKTKKK